MPTSLLSPAGPGTRTFEVTLANLLAVVIALTFRSQQRYPALLKKLHAGSAVEVAGSISFDTPALRIGRR